MPTYKYKPLDDDLVRLETLISRRNSLDPKVIADAVRAVRYQTWLESEDDHPDVADLDVEEDPWYLEARVITLEAALDRALDSRSYQLPDFRRAARGIPCQIRLPGVCRPDPETSVLAHVRRASVTGAGRKPCDLSAFVACYQCHEVYDKRRPAPGYMVRHEIELAAFDAVIRTHELWRQKWGFR